MTTHACGLTSFFFAQRNDPPVSLVVITTSTLLNLMISLHLPQLLVAVFVSNCAAYSYTTGTTFGQKLLPVDTRVIKI